MIQIASFWKKTSKNDRTYYQGKLGNGRLLLFKNEKKADKHPDLILYVVGDKLRRKAEESSITDEEDISF